MSDLSGNFGYWRRAEVLIDLALDEDLPDRDVSSEACVPADALATASIVAREDLVLSGIGLARRVFEKIDDSLLWEGRARSGKRVTAGTCIALVRGNARSLLLAERTALNFLQHLSGIATETSRVVERAGTSSVKILDTRKTTPGYRILEKAAVRHGGGHNHRFSLSDAVLLKDNHIAICGGITATLDRARKNLPPRTRVEIEVSTDEELAKALEAEAEVVLIDNFTPDGLRRALKTVGSSAAVEVSGGITFANIREMADTGVSMISLGSITHSARAVDISLDFVPERKA